MAKKNNTENQQGFVNPLAPGVSYEQFLNAIPEGKTPREYCENELNEDEIKWLEVELKHYQNNKNRKDEKE